MFDTLLESRAVRVRRAGSSFASILIHSAIISGGVAATAREFRAAEPEVKPVPPVHWVEPKVVLPPKPYAGAKRPAVSSDRAFVLTPRVVAVPLVVPVGIPEIDLSVPPPTYQMGNTRVGTAGVVCTKDCDAGPVVDASGNVLLSASDLAMRLAEQPVPPRYPESLRRAGIEGDVLVKFVVDTTGRVDPRSIEIVRSSHDAFTQAVRESLARLRFHPSRVGERKTSALAVMPFRFTLR